MEELKPDDCPPYDTLRHRLNRPYNCVLAFFNRQLDWVKAEF